MTFTMLVEKWPDEPLSARCRPEGWASPPTSPVFSDKASPERMRTPSPAPGSEEKPNRLTGAARLYEDENPECTPPRAYDRSEANSPENNRPGLRTSAFAEQLELQCSLLQDELTATVAVAARLPRAPAVEQMLPRGDAAAAMAAVEARLDSLSHPATAEESAALRTAVR